MDKLTAEQKKEIELKLMREGIIKKHLTKSETKDGVSVFFAYHEAMIEYASLSPSNEQEKEGGSEWYDIIEDCVDAISPSYNVKDVLNYLETNYNPPTKKN